jgi:hypothetical protein
MGHTTIIISSKAQAGMMACTMVRWLQDSGRRAVQLLQTAL